MNDMSRNLCKLRCENMHFTESQAPLTNDRLQLRCVVSASTSTALGCVRLRSLRRLALVHVNGNAVELLQLRHALQHLDAVCAAELRGVLRLVRIKRVADEEQVLELLERLERLERVELLDFVVRQVENAQVVQLLDTLETLDEVVRNPQLVERVRNTVQVFNLLDLVSSKTQNLQLVHAAQTRDLLNVVRRQREVLASLESGQRRIKLLDGRNLSPQLHLGRKKGLCKSGCVGLA